MQSYIPDKITLSVFNVFKQLGEAIEEEEKEYLSKQLDSLSPLILSLINKITHSKNTPIKIVEFGCGLNSLMWAVVASIATHFEKNIHYIGIDIDKKAIKKRIQLTEGVTNSYCKSSFVAGDASDAKNWLSVVGDSPSDVAIFMNPLVEDPFVAAADFSSDFSQVPEEIRLNNLEDLYQNFIHLSPEEQKSLNLDKKEVELLFTPSNHLKSLNAEQVDALSNIDKKFQTMRLQKLNKQFEQFKTIFNNILPNYFAKDSLLLILTFYETEFVALHRLLGISLPEKKSENDITCLAVLLNATKLLNNLTTELKAKPSIFSAVATTEEKFPKKEDKSLKL